jgi:hypothetical protein
MIKKTFSNILIILVLCIIGCITVPEKITGYVILEQNQRIEFKEARITENLDAITVDNQNEVMAFLKKDIKEFHFVTLQKPKQEVKKGYILLIDGRKIEYTYSKFYQEWDITYIQVSPKIIYKISTKEIKEIHNE